MASPVRIRGLIFDFDGLILDTEAPEFQCWQEIYAAHGCHLPLATWATCIGGGPDLFDPYAHLEGQLGRPIDRRRVESRRKRRYAELIQAQSVFPGVKPYIAEAERLGLKLGLASSSSRDWVTGHLSRLGIDTHFHSIKCADDVARVKPDPALYRAVLDALDLHANEAIAFEDSPNGLNAAKAAGIFCVAVPNGVTESLDFRGADIHLASLSELTLPALLAAIEGKRAGPA